MTCPISRFTQSWDSIYRCIEFHIYGQHKQLKLVNNDMMELHFRRDLEELNYHRLCLPLRSSLPRWCPLWTGFFYSQEGSNKSVNELDDLSEAIKRRRQEREREREREIKLEKERDELRKEMERRIQEIEREITRQEMKRKRQEWMYELFEMNSLGYMLFNSARLGDFAELADKKNLADKWDEVRVALEELFLKRDDDVWLSFKRKRYMEALDECKVELTDLIRKIEKSKRLLLNAMEQMKVDTSEIQRSLLTSLRRIKAHMPDRNPHRNEDLSEHWWAKFREMIDELQEFLQKIENESEKLRRKIRERRKFIKRQNKEEWRGRRLLQINEVKEDGFSEKGSLISYVQWKTGDKKVASSDLLPGGDCGPSNHIMIVSLLRTGKQNMLVEGLNDGALMIQIQLKNTTELKRKRNNVHTPVNCKKTVFIFDLYHIDLCFTVNMKCAKGLRVMNDIFLLSGMVSRLCGRISCLKELLRSQSDDRYLLDSKKDDELPVQCETEIMNNEAIKKEKNVVNLRTRTLENPDGSLDVSNELQLTPEDSTYNELCIKIRPSESSSRSFNSDKAMVEMQAHGHQMRVDEASSMNDWGKVIEDPHKTHKLHKPTTELQPAHAFKDYPFKQLYDMPTPSSLVVSVKDAEGGSVHKTETVEKPNRLRLSVAPSPSESLDDTDRGGGKMTCSIKEPYSSPVPVKEGIDWMFTDLPIPKLEEMTVFYTDRFEPLCLIISQIAEGKSPRPQVTMRYELLRLCTLRTYPRDNKPFLIKYAAAGFYYASDGDGVVCYCCGIRRYGWVEADDPMEVHKRINPRCKFIINNSEHNVPAMADGPLRKKVADLDMIPDCIRSPSPGEDVNNSQRTRTGVQMAIPKHPHMAIKTVREQSFNGNWPNTPKYSPVQLADGGFFFTDLGDCVRCFFCGIGLRHWDKDDDMWVEHARWSQNCTFLIQKKGQNFVDLVQLAVEQLDDSDQSSNTLYKNLVSEASQKVLDQSEYTPQQIKQAIVAMLAIDSNTIVTVTSLKQKVAEQILASDTSIKRSEGMGDAAEPPARNSVVTNEPSDNPEDIKQENEQLKEQTLCKVCLDNIVSIVFLPCGHLVTCADCAPALRKCPICRADVKGTVRTRMS
ncbi:uncharacterized protein LOC127850704 isoform X2 [Dreissena polymorpha]|uniref:uncharacterized protein LOC127850704 isoform X2 n=1 Tax=Dreissena polymorpha TaxID=45954 RepID=UPI0022646E7E|nr:uncharacterized protein LOC127850704 isoform X2 [Dreissena polymorpha]